MLIYRYFSRELINCLLTVTLIVLVIFLGNQLIRYLNDAASGNMALAVVGKLLLLEIPFLLALLLPITFFIALLLVLGRVSADHELIVLKACGLSPWQQWQMIAKSCFAVVGVVAILALWVQPKIALYRNQLLATTNAGASIDTLVPGKFQTAANNRFVLYVEQSSVDHKHLHNIFIAENRQPTAGSDMQWNIIKASSGELVEDLKNRAQFIQINSGSRYIGDIGTANYQIMQFSRYLMLSRNPSGNEMGYQLDAYNNQELYAIIKRDHADTANSLPRLAIAELEWRFSLPVTCLLLAILASRYGAVPPRYGRYARLFPGILILIIYINLLFVARGWVIEAKISRFPGIFWVHILLGLFILIDGFSWRRIWRSKQVKKQVAYESH